MHTGSGRWLALVIALGIALYLCWSMLQPFLNVILWAIVLVVAFQPVHRRLLARVGSPGWTAVLSTLLVVFTILVPTILITIAVLNEVSKVSGSLGSGAIEQGIANSPLAQRVITWITPYLGNFDLHSPDLLLERLQAWSGVIANSTLGVVGGVLSAVVQTFLVIFTMFYLFRDSKAINRAVYDLLPLEPSQTEGVIARTSEVISATVYGVIVIAAIQGTLGGIIFYILGLPSALLWAVVMFFLCMIPMAGAFLVWAPAAVFLALSGEWGKAMFLVAWGVLVVGSIDNFLSPRLVGKRAKLHELLIFFSVLGGIQVFGVLGLVLGPVVIALTLALLDVVRQTNRPPELTAREESIIDRQSEIRQAT